MIYFDISFLYFIRNNCINIVIIDNDGNIVDEVDVTIDKEIKKANILDYMLKNLRTIGAGKSLLKQN